MQQFKHRECESSNLSIFLKFVTDKALPAPHLARFCSASRKVFSSRRYDVRASASGSEARCAEPAAATIHAVRWAWSASSSSWNSTELSGTQAFENQALRNELAV